MPFFMVVLKEKVMTPQDVVEKIADREVLVEKLISRAPPNAFSMMLVNEAKTDKDTAVFNSMSYWQTCRETMSGHVRRRAMNKRCTYLEYTGSMDYWGFYPENKTIGIEPKKVFGPEKPMCILINKLSMNKAKQAKRLLNELESYSKPNAGKTEILECRMVNKQVKIKGKMYDHTFDLPGVIFVIPKCWTQTVPHLSLYLLIIRSTYTLTPRKDESLEDFWRRLVKIRSKRDKTRIKNILTGYPDLPITMIKCWQLLVDKLHGKNGRRKWYNSVNSTEGIDSLLYHARRYATAPGRIKGQTIASRRKQLIANTRLGHREMVQHLARYIVRYNNKKKNEAG